ncbi:MAG: TlpA family protein disulfide reductase [Acidobacteria bacterium]|nr:TlpA family protein disulfide reductase [Acidobacteriota bacterium]
MFGYYRRVGRLVLLVAMLGILAGCDRGTRSRPVFVGATAPRFEIRDSDKTITLDQFRGRVVVLNFWASWCPPCIEELPSLQVMAQQAQQHGIVVLAVSEDESETNYRQFLSDHHMEMLTTVRDAQRSAAPLYGTFQFPETYVIDPNGIVRRKFVGPADFSKPEVLESLLGLQRETPAPSRAAR